MTREERHPYIRQIATFPERLEALVLAIKPDRLDERYRPGGWTIRQVVHHLVDSHVNAFIRMRSAVVSPGSNVMGYDQDGWSELPDNREMPVEISLDFLKCIHGRWAYMLDGLPESVWSHSVIHSENGPETMEEMLVDYAEHGDHHFAQIQTFTRSGTAVAHDG